MTEPLIADWYTTGDDPHLLGTKCSGCGTYFFPALDTYCRNPACESTQFETVELSRTGKLWSFTNAGYSPPAPYVAADPYEPFAIAAVELDKEKMIVLGQIVEGVGVEGLSAGMEMELVMEPVPHDDDADGRLIWKWRPAT